MRNGRNRRKKGDLLLAEPRDIDERLRAAEHREQTQQQHLSERINDFAELPRVRQILEIIQKNNGFADRPKFLCSPLHRVPPQTESEDHDRFSTSALCHELLHPIALRGEGIGLDKTSTRI